MCTNLALTTWQPDMMKYFRRLWSDAESSLYQ